MGPEGIPCLYHRLNGRRNDPDGGESGGQIRHSVTHEIRFLCLMFDGARQQIIAFTYDCFLGLPATIHYRVETLGPQVYDLIHYLSVQFTFFHFPRYPNVLIFFHHKGHEVLQRCQKKRLPYILPLCFFGY